MGSQTSTTRVDVPREMQQARSQTLKYLFNNLNNPQKAPFDLSYKPTELTSGAENMYKYLLGGTAGGTGGPQGVSGQTLDQMIPMAGITPDVTNMLREGLSSGFAVDTSPVWQAKKAAYGQNIQDQITQAMQDMAFTGSRYGTGAMNVGGNIAQRGALQLASEMAPLEMGAQENAANRRLQAGQQGLTMADMYNQAALARAAGASTSGNQEWQNRNQAQQQQLQDWLRTQPGYGPIFEALMQYSTNYPFQTGGSTTTPFNIGALLNSIFNGASSAGTAALLA